MNCLKPMCLLACLISIPVLADTPYNAALSDLKIPDPGIERPLTGWVWYPTLADLARKKIAGNAVWTEIRAQRDAPMASGRHPLVLLSHGMYGNIYNQGWLASALASRGYVVAAVNHPGSTSRNRNEEQAKKLWQRSRDLGRIIDHLLADPLTGRSIDPQKIAAAGHSLGGYTVMRLLGAIHDDQRHDESCEPNPRRIDCRVVRQLGVGRSDENSNMLLESVQDTRIQAVVTLDLGGTQTFTPASLKSITRPVMVIGAGRIGLLDQRLESLALVDSLPAASVHYLKLPDGGHFDFLGSCTDRALAILKEEEPEDAVVCDNGGDARVQKHKLLVREIVEFLSRHGIG